MNIRQSLQRAKHTSPEAQTHSPTAQQAPAPLRQPTHPAALIQRALAAPGALHRAEVLQLQRTMGNRAVGRLVNGGRKMIPTTGLSQELLATRSSELVMQAK